MKTACRVLIMVFLVPLVLFAAEEAQQQTSQVTPEVLAVAGSEQWLKVIDADNYDKAWTYASEYLKNELTKDDFKQKLQRVKSPLGKMKKRVFSASRYATPLRGYPDGEYVVIKFKTEFENKADAVETLISRKEEGQWKVAGYFIK